ncbi:MAG: ATP-binding cassette domain-containing protein, partial [Lachnospiraceae bacterium]|nr:ATP-binding cassette domain-containing protein [Lachnospiraceae bacterium]
GLSEGQMQRIAIARALYADAPVLILDEATSALDEMTEKRLLEQLKRLTNKTILIATHRKAALDICNKQLVFGDGFSPRITEKD